MDRLLGRNTFTAGPDGQDNILLSRGSPAVSLTEQNAATGSLRVSLTWQMRQEAVTGTEHRWGSLRPSALFKPIAAEAPTATAMVNVDLDLGCMYELTDGSRGVVQPLGGLFGDFDRPPYVQLSGDDRFGSPSGETLYVNLDMHEKFKRLLIFVYIYDGTPAFDRTKAVVTLYPYVGPRIVVRLDERAPQARSCAVAMIENRDGHLRVRREVRYVYGFQTELDRLYGWGLEWARGYKTKT